MSDILKTIKERQSTRTPFDPKRPVSKEALEQILEAGRWAPTAHNMQNFEIVVVDDGETLEKLGNIKSRISEVFLRENYEQLSFSKEELLKKRTGILGTTFPASWVDPSKMAEVARESTPLPLNQSIRGSPTLLIVIYDPARRAPASEGDVLGFMSLGCLMENMWLMATSLGIRLQILSTFAAPPVEKELKKILGIPDRLKVAYCCRLGYSAPAQDTATATAYLRVRREIKDFVHNNGFGKKGN